VESDSGYRRHFVQGDFRPSVILIFLGIFEGYVTIWSILLV
jgi:hypothetical protein